MIPKKDEHALFREEGGESIVFLPEYGRLKKLNQMGTIIWNLIDGKRTADNIAKEICNQLGGNRPDEGKILNDVNSFLDKLKEGGFISYE